MKPGGSIHYQGNPSNFPKRTPVCVDPFAYLGTNRLLNPKKRSADDLYQTGLEWTGFLGLGRTKVRGNHLASIWFVIFPLLVLKGICHYWTYVFPEALTKWKLGMTNIRGGATGLIPWSFLLQSLSKWLAHASRIGLATLDQVPPNMRFPRRPLDPHGICPGFFWSSASPRSCPVDLGASQLGP